MESTYIANISPLPRVLNASITTDRVRSLGRLEVRASMYPIVNIGRNKAQIEIDDVQLNVADLASPTQDTATKPFLGAAPCFLASDAKI